jgi:ubiquinol-cytochrome c reductase cytochrome c subunit
MPVFSEDVLTPQAKREVIAYINSIDEAPAYGGAELGSYGPVAEGLFAWVLGIGSLVGFAVWIAANSTRSKKVKKSAGSQA